MTITRDRQEPPERLISVRDAARLLAISEQTVRHWLYLGRMTKYRVGRCVRLDKVEVLALIRSQEKR